jgi:hypothetical protein
MIEIFSVAAVGTRWFGDGYSLHKNIAGVETTTLNYAGFAKIVMGEK